MTTPGQNAPAEAVAVIGMAGRFPGAPDVAAFWANLAAGRDTISRWNPGELEFSNERIAGASDGQFVRARSVLDHADEFDAGFFGIYPRQAELMDPQHRLFLECSWEALESAGYDSESYPGLIGLYAGLAVNTYLLYNLCSPPGAAPRFAAAYPVGSYDTLFGNDKDFMTTRVAYKLNLRGPCMTVQTACSTSLVAVANAVHSLLSYQCDMALAGGVSVTFPQKRDYLYSPDGMVSRDGTCRTFDAAASGTVFGGGVGVVVLKRLSEALADGDHVQAVLLGAAINNDGSARVGYAAPGVDGQAEVIALAHAAAGVDPDSISYIEAHGTGTPLGDPIEIAALTRAFRQSTTRTGYCAIGTAKTNIGHLEIAAGVTGLIKTILQLQHGQIAPLVHFRAPNPHIDFAQSPFYPVAKLTEWKRDAGAGPRRAGVSAFGVGGTNAHVVVEEAPLLEPTGPSRPRQLLLLSAKTPTALDTLSRNLASWLENPPTFLLSAFSSQFSDTPSSSASTLPTPLSEVLADVSFTLQRGRKYFAHRRALVVSDTADAIAKLRVVGDQTVVTGQVASRESSIVFLFPGQGAQYVDMGRELYDSEPVFRAEIDRCAGFLRGSLGLDLRHVLYPDPAGRTAAGIQINETAITQPAIFVVEYALARLWMSWGVKPGLLIGHSIGEYVAAVLSGVFTLVDALTLLATRARLMQALPAGAMLAVRLGESGLLPLLPADVSIAALNSPKLTTVSGPVETLKRFEQELASRKIAARFLQTSHAFHSAMMDPMLAEFAAAAKATPCAEPRLSWISTCTGRPIDVAELADGTYWARQVRQPVRFTAALDSVVADARHVLLEVGPGQALCQLVKQHPGQPADLLVVPSLGSNSEPSGELGAILASLGRLWIAGISPDWSSFYQSERRRRVPLPTYPFERKRFWIEPAETGGVPSVASPPPTDAAHSVVPPSTSGSSSVALDSRSSNPAVMNATVAPLRSSTLALQIRATIKELSGIAIESDTTTFMELGFDSLFLTQASQALQKQFGLKVSFRQLINELNSVSALAAFLDQSLPPDRAPVVASGNGVDAPPQPGNLHGQAAFASPVIQQLLVQQSELLHQQLALLRTLGLASDSSGHVPGVPVPNVQLPTPNFPTSATSVLKSFATVPADPSAAGRALTPGQRAWLDELVSRYTRKTAGSKALTQRYRQWYADPRTASGFNQLWKEICYQIVVTRSRGSRLWDTDGNEYIDLLNGFGPGFLGHSPDFITAALKDQLDRGIEVGPQSPLAGEAARLFCEFTGNERASFVCTGSEAVYAAMRLARTVTGRDKIVVFSRDYHGNFDEVLVRAVGTPPQLRTMPIAPGIPFRAVEDVYVLDYGTDAALDFVRSHASEIAAVLVEPVQSRRPEWRPLDFIRQLRQLTTEQGSLLVFDEVVTGLRAGPGGAQAFYGVKADLATYGKVIGGGMPIGIVAGKAEFMDTFDGGFWQYGDESGPSKGVTFFAGTFVRHPLAIAAVHAMLKFLQGQGPEFWETINRRAARLAETVDRFCVEHGAPVRLPHFCSLLYVRVQDDQKFGNLLFYRLREKGVFLLDHFPSYLTAAHSDEDVDRVIAAFQESIVELQREGFLSTVTASVASRSEPAVVPAAPPSSAPLTEAQREIFFSVQMGPEANCAYNEASIIHFRGALDRSSLRQALVIVFGRHPALRSSFAPDGEHQFFPPATDQVSLVEEDLSPLSAADRDSRLAELRRLETATPFDLLAGPLVRLRLLSLAADEHQLLFTAHHLVCDGWSFGMLIAEVCAAYNAVHAGRPLQLPPAMPFAEFAGQLKSQLAGDDFRSAQDYWLARFQDGPPVLELPLDRPRPSLKTYAAAMESRRIPDELFARLKFATPKLGGTLFTTLLAACATLLHRLTGQEDLVIGIPAAGQTMIGCNELVGHCLNFLPLRLRPVGDASFSVFARNVQNLVLDAYDHQQMTYGTMVHQLKLPRDTSRLPLVSVMFNIDKSGFDLLKFDGLEFHVEANPKQFTNFELFFNLVQTETSLEFECEYNTDLFDRATIRGWLEAFEALVAGVIEGGLTTLDGLPLLGELASRALLREWQGVAVAGAGGESLSGRVAAVSRRAPGKAAVRCGGRVLTYGELDLAADAVAGQLASLGVGPGALVGLCVERSVDMVVGLLGILKAGAAYVPMDPAFPAERLGWMIEDAALPVIVTQTSLVEALPPHQARLICLDQPNLQLSSRAAPKHLSEGGRAAPEPLGEGGSSSADPEPGTRNPEPGTRNPEPGTRNPEPGTRNPEPGTPTPRSDDLAYVIFTSGSTGRPKGVQISHRAVVNFLDSMRREPGLTPADVLLSVTTLSFDIAGLELFLPLTTGATVVIASRETAADGYLLRRELETSGATVMQATPVTWRLLLEAGWTGDPRLKILIGGEAVPRELVNQLAPRCGSLWNMYGPTETTIWSTTGRLEAGEGPVSIGRPIDNTQVYIVNRQLQLQPVGVPGELLIGGDGLAVGYLQRPELTAEKFIPNPFGAGRVYRTGDLAKWRADGTIECLGRLDQQVKIRGYRIELGEIEARLATHPDVKQAVVVAREDTPGDRRLVGYVVPSVGAAPAAGRLRDYLRGTLPEYMVPAAVVVLPELPVTPNGKINRLALPPPEGAATPDSNHLPIPPSSAEERTMFGFWVALLHRDNFGVTDDIFELGADSILIFQFCARCVSAGIQVSPAMVFRHRTIDALASQFAAPGAPASAAAPAIIPVDRRAVRRRA